MTRRTFFEVPAWWPFHFGAYATLVAAVLAIVLGGLLQLVGVDYSTWWGAVIQVFMVVGCWVLAMYIFIVRGSQ